MTTACVFNCARIVLTVALLVAALTSTGCALRRRPAASQDYGIPACAVGAEGDFLSPAALQCWFDDPDRRWRTLGHQQHLEAPVIDVEARELRDAETIARRLVDDVSRRFFSEVLIYVQDERERSRVRRVRWTQNRGFETLDFSR